MNVKFTGTWHNSISSTTWHVGRVPVSCHGKKEVKVDMVARQVKVMQDNVTCLIKHTARPLKC